MYIQHRKNIIYRNNILIGQAEIDTCITSLRQKVGAYYTVAYYALPKTTDFVNHHQLATTHTDTTFIDNLAASMKRVPQTHCINCASSKHSAGAVTITMNQSPEKISGPSLLTLSSLLHPTAAVTCGSARGKAAMSRSLLRKDGRAYFFYTRGADVGQMLDRIATDRSNNIIAQHLLQTDFRVLPFQNHGVLIRGITQNLQMSLKRGRSQLIPGNPPDFRSSVVLLWCRFQRPGFSLVLGVHLQP